MSAIGWVIMVALPFLMLGWGFYLGRGWEREEWEYKEDMARIERIGERLGRESGSTQ